MKDRATRILLTLALMVYLLPSVAFAQTNRFADLLDANPVTPTPSPTPEPKLCIAHRGASDKLPEHTLEAYQAAMAQGADYIDIDLQITNDGVLICLHDPTLQRTTDVALKFPDRYMIPDPKEQLRKTWRAVDFTLEEIKTLDAGAHVEGFHENLRVPTLQEVIYLLKSTKKMKPGLYIEIKNTKLYNLRGYRIVEALLDVLERNNLNTPEGLEEIPIIIQSFSAEDLKEVRRQSRKTYPLVQRVDYTLAPATLTEVGLIRVAEYAGAIATDLDLLLNRPERVGMAHAQGLEVYAYSLNWESLPKSHSDLQDYARFVLYDLGVDGALISDPKSFPR